MSDFNLEQPSQNQTSQLENINVSGDFTYAPSQHYTITNIIQVSVEEITKRTLIKSSPYKGLKRFNIADREDFFGRDKLIDKLFQATNRSSISFVLGASGSGKSSVVRAGLIPELKKTLESQSFYDFIFTPNEDPFQSFYRCLLNEEKNYNFQPSEAKIVLESQKNTLLNSIKSLKKDGDRWLIFIDQFEQIFTPSIEAEKRKNFIDGLVQVAKSEDSFIKIIIAMRADFLEQFSSYPELGAIANQNNFHLVTEMFSDQLKQAIEQPAAKHGVVFEEGLVKEIIEEVQGQKGYLPLLQYTLNLLWDSECKSISSDGNSNIERRVLTRKTYHLLEGVRGALQKRVNEIYSNFNQDEQKITKQVFLKLINIVDGDSGRKRISQKAYYNEFANGSENAIIDILVRENLLVSSNENISSNLESLLIDSAQKKTSSAIIEIAHETLLSSWDILNNWLKEEEEAILLKSWLIGEVRRWERIRLEDESKSVNELLRGLQLERVLKFINIDSFKGIGGLSPLEQEYINISQEEKDRQEKEKEDNRKRELKQAQKIMWLSLAAAGTAIIALGIGFLSLLKQGADERVIFDAWLRPNIPEKELLNKLPTLSKAAENYTDTANKSKKEEDIERALVFNQRLIDISEKFLNENNNLLVTKKREEIIKIHDLASSSLTNIIIKHRLPQLKNELESKDFGKVLSDREYEYNDKNRFTGALKTTRAMLFGNWGAKADLNDDGLINNDEEAQRMPLQVLEDIEALWSKHQCHWFNQNTQFENYEYDEPDCEPLQGNTLGSLIFDAPYDYAFRQLHKLTPNKATK